MSDTGQNLRHNVNKGGTTIADLALNYTPGTNATGIVGAAYTNNDLDARTATTLFDLDTSLDQIAIQAPPNNGSLSPTGMTSVDSGNAAGFEDRDGADAQEDEPHVDELHELTHQQRRDSDHHDRHVQRRVGEGDFVPADVAERDDVVDFKLMDRIGHDPSVPCGAAAP